MLEAGVIVFLDSVIVNFARQMNASGGKTVSSSVASAAIAQAQWSMVGRLSDFV